MMTQGISANGLHSYLDFDLYIAERTVTPGAKKEIKKTVPYMNGSYDFSAINGEPAYEEAELKYVFDIAETSTEEMERQKNKIEDWLYNILDTDITDDYSQGYYYHGSLEEIEWEEDFGQGHLTAVFKVYPFKFKKELTTKRFTKGSAILLNTSSHAVFPILQASEDMTVQINGTSYGIQAGKREPKNLVLQRGENTVEVINETGYLDILYREERFC